MRRPRPAADDLVGLGEIASRLGLSGERARQIAVSGRLPRPVGHVGRQDVYRWTDVEAWAVETGRLARGTDGFVRQATRVWLPGHRVRRRRVVDELLAWGVPARPVHVRVWEPTDDPYEPPVVLLGNLEDSRGRSVTNDVESVAALVADRFLDGRAPRAQFYEHWSHALDDGPRFAHVTFETGPPPRSGHGGRRSSSYRSPSWRDVDREELEDLVGEPVEVWTHGTYTSALVALRRSRPGDRVGAVWDPHGARAAQAAVGLWDGLCGDVDRSGLVVGCLAAHALWAAVEARVHVRAQVPDSPVWLAEPRLDDRERLVLLAEAHEDATPGELWEALTAVRATLAAADPSVARTLAPAVGGGLARLAWWEAGEDEPSDARDGVLGRIVVEEDLLPATSPPPPSRSAALRAAEIAVGRLLARPDAGPGDGVPALRPAGPYRAVGRWTCAYLDGVAWGATPAEPTRADRVARLVADTEAAEPRVGTDPYGRAVAVSADGSSFAVEWPAGPASADVLAGSVVLADPETETGPVPVFLQLADGGLDLLPAHPSEVPSHDFTWGYAGGGPWNLSRAVADVVQAAALAAGAPVGGAAARAVAREAVAAARPPAYRVDELVVRAGLQPVADEGT